MKATANSYDIHGLVRLKVEGGCPRGFFQSLSYPYSYFASETVSDPDIIVQLGSFEPYVASGQLIDHKYLVGFDRFAVNDSAPGARWKVEVSGLESDKIRIRFHGKCRPGILSIVPEFLAHHVVIRPLVELVLSWRGAAVVHGGGIEKGGEGFVLSGRGGVHKTSMVMDLVRRHGFSYLGDDRIILFRGKVLAYPYLVGLFDFRVSHLEKENLTLSNRIALAAHLAGLCRNRDFSWRVSESANLSSLAEINRTNVKAVQRESLEIDTAVRKAVASARLELLGGDPRQLGVRSNHFYNYLKAYLYANLDSKLAHMWTELAQSLRRNLAGANLVSVNIPMSYEAEQAKRVSELLMT